MAATRLAVLRGGNGDFVTDESPNTTKSRRSGEAAKADDPRTRIDELVQRSKRLHHRILEPSVLRGTLPLRARAVRHAAEQSAARDRERRFRELSSSYAEAIDAEWSRSDARAISFDSLTWWVPLSVPDDPAAVEHALGHQHFPYRVITQTRELAVGGGMIDIGANTGRMSVSRVILGDVDVAYCAEPEPLNYACLVRNVKDNLLTGLVLPDHLAIGSADGVVRLERTKSTGGHRVLGADATSKREVVEVRSLRLDTWVEHLGIDLMQVRFVKVDAQGSEVDVLRGASEVLARKHIAWQVEIDLKLLARRGLGANDLYVLMQQHFTHFIDLNGRLTGDRVRRVGELAEALAYVTGGTAGRTDVLLFTMDSTPDSQVPTSKNNGRL
jgi:FkbM family methyltransferase